MDLHLGHKPCRFGLVGYGAVWLQPAFPAARTAYLIPDGGEGKGLEGRRASSGGSRGRRHGSKGHKQWRRNLISVLMDTTLLMLSHAGHTVCNGVVWR